jgi:hypothetical protein
MAVPPAKANTAISSHHVMLLMTMTGARLSYPDFEVSGAAQLTTPVFLAGHCEIHVSVCTSKLVRRSAFSWTNKLTD